MNDEKWEKVRDELEVISNTADYGIDCVDSLDELQDILKDIKRSYGNIVHIVNEK